MHRRPAMPLRTGARSGGTGGDLCRHSGSLVPPCTDAAALTFGSKQRIHAAFQESGRRTCFGARCAAAPRRSSYPTAALVRRGGVAGVLGTIAARPNGSIQPEGSAARTRLIRKHPGQPGAALQRAGGSSRMACIARGDPSLERQIGKLFWRHVAQGRMRQRIVGPAARTALLARVPRRGPEMSPPFRGAFEKVQHL